jgi:epsilon-lactone hydrolase
MTSTFASQDGFGERPDGHESCPTTHQSHVPCSILCDVHGHDGATAGGEVVGLPTAPDAIELRHLRAFVAVADELSFSRAAQRLYLSQPALSRQIRVLERLIGRALLRRTTRRVELTLAGEALREQATRMLEDLDGVVAAVRAVGDDMAARMAALWAPVGELDPTARDGLRELRESVEALHARFPLPPDIRMQPVNASGTPSLQLSSDHQHPTSVLYLHGGGYVSGSAYGYRPLAGYLATAAQRGVLLPEYRLAPEHPHPAAVEDALHAYEWILDSGVAPEHVTLVGDSAGAGLALTMMLALEHRALPQPGRAALLCPWVDLRCAHHDHPTRDPQPVIGPEQLRRFAAMYLSGHPIDDPLVDPLHADLSGLPPLLIQSGTGDPLLQDARRLAGRARECGISAQLELFPVDAHDFHVFWSFLPDARQALQEVGRFAAADRP